MASSSADASSQPRRPAPMARQHSSTSHISQSPSDSTHHKPQKPRQHVVGGHSRMQRNHSSKNLPKLTKLTQTHAGDGNQTKHHRRSQSGTSISAPSSPRPSFKRNASSGGVVRLMNQAHAHGHAHGNIRKNHSSGHLAHKAKPALKSTKSEIAPPKRSLAHPGKATSPSPDHPTVHFDMGDDEEEGHDDGWTEESASQSPNTTRSNTRSNSVILDTQRTTEGASQRQTGESSRNAAVNPPPHAPSSTANMQTLPDRTHHARPSNGGSSHHSRPPDADMITSRLLQRSAQHNVPTPPQLSSIAASVVSNHNEVRELSQSAGSTLVDTPGRDLVSRFMDGEGSAGTPNNSSFLPSRNSPQAGNDSEKMKRNKSMPNVAGADTPTRSQSRRSGSSTPSDLPPSRTQQKLMLQRASSNIEPQKLIPVILPRMGGPTFLHTGMTYASNGEGRLDPRLQQQFNHVAVEYSVVRRYRNPLADAIRRIDQIPGTPRKTRTHRSANGHVSAHGVGSLSTSFNDETEGRRARVSFENGRDGRGGADLEGRQSFESDNGRVRNEAEEICRRLWESAEAVDGE